MLTEWIKHRVIGSPLHRPAEILRCLAGAPKRIRHPELRDTFLEGPRAREVIAPSVSRGMNCLHVGAHLGSVLKEFVHLSPQGHPIAIEPLPYKAAWLRKSYPQVQIVEAAVSETEGEIEFQWNMSRPGFSSLASAGLAGDLLERVQVHNKPLDSIVPSNLKIGFMKVDVLPVQSF